MKLAEKLRQNTDNYFIDQKKVYENTIKDNEKVLFEKLDEILLKASLNGKSEVVIEFLILAKLVGSFGNLGGMNYLLFIEYSLDLINNRLTNEGFSVFTVDQNFRIMW